MKKIQLLILLAGFAITSFLHCTVDKEPEIPTGANNGKAPVFLSTSLTAITHDSLRAQARLSSRGNLNILHYGWVWSEKANPTMLDSKLELNTLEIDSFQTLIPGFILGKNYHLRPYVVTGAGETYGPEKTVFMGVPKLDNLVLSADSACFLRVQGSIQSPTPPVEYGIVYLKGTGMPTLQEKDGQAPGAGLNNGSFQTDLTMLTPNTTYVLRAYATTASGTGYSRPITVTTPSSSLLAANFSLDSVDLILFQGAVVHFINASIGATAYSWSFGDAATSTEASPVHTFNTLGNMTVRLQAENGGCRLTKEVGLKIIDNPFKDYWVAIPGGTFMMGCTPEQGAECDTNEMPVHQVTLSPFFMGRTEVTQKQWLSVIAVNTSAFYQCGPDCPVERVSWRRIVEEFIPALRRKTGRTYRLPTEAEWEYAARGGADASSMTKYAGSDSLDLVGWYEGNSGNMTHPVGQKLPNGYGLSDMSGNVSEWCSDWYSPSQYSYAMGQTLTDPAGPTSGEYHVERGGSLDGSASKARVSYRGGNFDYAYWIGFRLAVSPQ